jgi:DNA-binding transcriptional ArsR family regulator
MDIEVVKQAQAQANLCRTFNNVYRILILWMLVENEEMAVNDIARTICATGQNTSQHLRLMKDRGLLATRREGTTIYYRLVHSQMLDACDLLAHKPQLNQ